ncbi:hypothetical protein P5673_001356 [Acropora cervicornis]|uniref:Uncharacterized protein n=1 Tax=Acropora cervicornis TaxID=6130 RepID=A0AAD9R5U3_ACRCE|nr:hypothetical protein P5673_001356 [Acropora cervicornis]
MPMIDIKAIDEDTMMTTPDVGTLVLNYIQRPQALKWATRAEASSGMIIVVLVMVPYLCPAMAALKGQVSIW